MQVRFLFPVLPLFNIAAAAAGARLWLNRHKSLPWQLAGWATLGLMACSLVASCGMLYISAANYPGEQLGVCVSEGEKPCLIAQP